MHGVMTIHVHCACLSAQGVAAACNVVDIVAVVVSTLLSQLGLTNASVGLPEGCRGLKHVSKWTHNVTPRTSAHLQAAHGQSSFRSTGKLFSSQQASHLPQTQALGSEPAHHRGVVAQGLTFAWLSYIEPAAWPMPTNSCCSSASSAGVARVSLSQQANQMPQDQCSAASKAQQHLHGVGHQCPALKARVALMQAGALSEAVFCSSRCAACEGPSRSVACR